MDDSVYTLALRPGLSAVVSGEVIENPGPPA